VRAALVRNNLHPRPQAGFAGGGVRDDIEHRAVVLIGLLILKNQAQGKPYVHEIRSAFGAAQIVVHYVGVDKPPAAVLDPAERRSRADGIQACAEEASPVVWLHLVHRGHHVVERVGHDSRCAARASVEAMAEIVERALAAALSRCDGVGLTPDREALIVKTAAAAPGRPGPPRAVENWRSQGCILERPPRTTRPVVEVRSHPGEMLAVGFGIAQGA